MISSLLEKVDTTTNYIALIIVVSNIVYLISLISRKDMRGLVQYMVIFLAFTIIFLMILFLKP